MNVCQICFSYECNVRLIQVAVVLLAIVACVVAKGTYTTKYDNIDVEQILKNDRLLNNYVKCLLDTGRCTPDGTELKSKSFACN